MAFCTRHLSRVAAAAAFYCTSAAFLLAACFAAAITFSLVRVSPCVVETRTRPFCVTVPSDRSCSAFERKKLYSCRAVWTRESGVS
eukprot:IDg3889t1